MTQKHLSKLSGISTSMISAIELGERHPTVPVLDALARALQVKVTDLYSRKILIMRRSRDGEKAIL